MKLNNFKSIDPTYTDTGKVGLWRTSKEDKSVWSDYSNSFKELNQIANAIVKNIDQIPTAPTTNENSNDVAVASEGRLLSRIHKTRERNKALVNKKKRLAIQKNKTIACEACGFDYSTVYGAIGENYIEAHHNKPLHTLLPDTETTLNDLTLLCANCHRIIHRNHPWLTVEELKKTIHRQTAQ